MMNKIYHQNTFSRTLANEGKMGAYYTDLEHCKDIAKMFQFSEIAETFVLEPAIGDASAVITVTGANKNPNIKIFGVELNDSTFEAVKQNPYVEDVLKADFLNDVMISNNVFSFCFGNPPYLDDMMDSVPGSRTERSFLEKVGNYLCTGAILVWVIPFYIYKEESYLRYYNSRYELLHLYRFREKEFKKFQQIVLIGRKKKLSNMLSKVQMEQLKDSVSQIEKIQELPMDFEEKIEVPTSDISKLTLFATRNFDVNLAYETIDSLPEAILSELNEILTERAFGSYNIGNPPIPLKKDSMYLLATSGGGQGLTGDEKSGDLHLQRGVAEVIEEPDFEVLGEGKNKKTNVRVTSRTQITMTVIQNDGTISKLV